MRSLRNTLNRTVRTNVIIFFLLIQLTDRLIFRGICGLQNENCHLDAGRYPAGRTCEPQVKAVQLFPAPWGESLKPRQDTRAL